MSQRPTNYEHIIKTINSDDDISNEEESSDDEVELQPSKRKKNSFFDDDCFKFESATDYNRDSWNDLNKYVKRKASKKTDDKIEKYKKGSGIQADGDKEKQVDYASDFSLSSEDLQHDAIRVKEKAKKKKKIASKIDKVEEEEEELYSYDENLSFHEMHFTRHLLKAITQMNYTHPTPIQAATIPVALQGKDIYACAATGTGKTAAFMLPTLQRLVFRPYTTNAVTRVLVLVPTRELGVQVYQVTKQLCQFTNIEVGLAVGGLDVKAQETVLRKNPDIVIATPGRLIDHLYSTPNFGLESVEVLILDEADRMLDEHFAEQMKEIMRLCSRTRQTMLFSATMSNEVDQLVSISLKSPVRVFVDSNKGVAFNLRQEFVRVRSNDEKAREAILAALVCRTFRERCIIFVSTKQQAHRLHLILGLLGLKVGELHGNLTQPQRLDTLERFKSEVIDIVVATDVAARGLDISGVKTVINYSIPNTLEHYIHRVGRTARAGRAGISVSLSSDNDKKMLKKILQNCKRPPKKRIIPKEIMEKYAKKVGKLQETVEKILKEEKEERQLRAAENKINKVENIINGETERPWFQTKEERKKEKKALSKKGKSPKVANSIKNETNLKSSRKQKKKEVITNKVSKSKVNPLDKMAKRKQKPKKIRSCPN